MVKSFYVTNIDKSFYLTFTVMFNFYNNETDARYLYHAGMGNRNSKKSLKKLFNFSNLYIIFITNFFFKFLINRF